MLDFILESFELLSVLDVILITFILLNLIISFNAGFVSSLFSFLKWIIAFVSVKFLLPVFKPFVEDFVESNFVVNLILGISIFILSMFIIIIISRSLNKVLKWSGLGSVDKLFGLFFGAFKGYAYFIVLFTISNAIYPVNKWHKSLNSGIFTKILSMVKILVNNFSNRQEYFDDGKDKIEKFQNDKIK